jgi:NTE family protein
MKVIFALEDFITDGIISVEEGDEIIKEAREIITTEQLLYRISKEEVIEAYSRFVKRIEAKDISPERKEKLLDPGRDIIFLISKEGIFKHAS